MVNALFAYMGSELVGVTCTPPTLFPVFSSTHQTRLYVVGEAKNPRKTVPATIKRTFWRLLIFYIGSVFVVGLIVSAKDPDLLSANKQSTSAAASPFVVAIKRANIKVLPECVRVCRISPTRPFR
jgi:amino acid transporter